MAVWRGSRQNIRAANNFAGGINTGYSPFDIKPDESIAEFGWDTDLHPSLATRKGRTAFGASGGAITRLLTNYGNKHLVRAVGTQLQWWNGAAWTNITGAFTNTDWDAANFDIGGSVLILTNGTDTVAYWNGTALTNISAAPKGKYIASDNRRVYIATKDVVNFCGFQNALDWTSPLNSGAVQFYTANGGDITALHSFAGQIWAFKKDSYCLIFHTGDSRATHRLVEGSNNIGCVSHKTVVEVGDLLFWLGADDVYIGAGGTAQGIGQPVRDVLNRLNVAAFTEANAWTDGIRYYLCVCTGTNTTVDTELMYDPRYKKWRIRSVSQGGQRYGAFFGNVPYGGFTDGVTYQLNSGTTDNGTAIVWSVTSRPFDEGVKEAEKELYELHIQGYFSPGSTVQVYVSTDDRGETFIPISFDASTDIDAQSKNLIIPLDQVPLTNWYRYRIAGTGYVEIYEVQRYCRLQPVQH